jgi:hypothetical protein
MLKVAGHLMDTTTTTPPCGPGKVDPMMDEPGSQTNGVSMRMLTTALGLLLLSAGLVSLSRLSVQAVESPSVARGAGLVILTAALLVFSRCVYRNLSASKGS